MIHRTWLDEETTAYVAVEIDRDADRPEGCRPIYQLGIEIGDGGGNVASVDLLPRGGSEDFAEAERALEVLGGAIDKARDALVKMVATERELPAES